MATRYNSVILCSCWKNASRYASRQSCGYQDFEGAPSELITSLYPKKTRGRQRRNVSKLERIFDRFGWEDIWKDMNLSSSNTDHFNPCWQQARQIMWWVNSTQYSVCIYQMLFTEFLGIRVLCCLDFTESFLTYSAKYERGQNTND